MTTITIGSNNFKVIEEIKQLLRNRFGNEVFIDEEKQLKREKGKWADFADEVRGTMSKETSEYLQKCSQEIRDGFEIRDLATK